MYVYVYIHVSEQDFNFYSLILKRSCFSLSFISARASKNFTPYKLWTVLCFIVAIRNNANVQISVAFCVFVYRNLKAVESPDRLPDPCMHSALIHFRTIINSFCAVKSNHDGVQCLLNRTRTRSVYRDAFHVTWNGFWGLACLYSHWCTFVCSFVFVHGF